VANSNILGIYNAIEALTVTVGTVTPTVLDVDELPNSLETAQLPARLLLPVATFDQSAEGSLSWVTLKGLTRVRWRIRDLCLWRPVGQGIGLRTIMPILVQYCGLYLDEMTDNRDIMDGAHLDPVRIEPRAVEWPEQSGKYYWAIDAVIEVSEYLST
jgi:hypothetical protein